MSNRTVLNRSAARGAAASPRSAARGAALPEAVIVVGVLVFIWAAMAMAFVGGRSRLNAQWEARVATMYYASNDCKHSLPTLQAPSSAANGQLPQGSGNAESDGVAGGAPNEGGNPEARSSFFLASGSSTHTSTLLNWSATKTSSSWAVCNETAYNGDFIGLVQYGADMFHDLLPGPVQSLF